jgi:D-glucosaminate-6-phosphate ammonia-lyase
MGAALAIFSGGKDLHGPQASGLVVGRKDLIDAMRVNGSPNHSIGRPMKVGKEEMAGLLAAVKRYVTLDHEGRASQDEETVSGWCHELNKLPGVNAERSFPNEAGQPLPRAKITLDVSKAGLSRDELVKQLADGEPSIMVSPAGKDGIYVNPMTLSEGEDQVVLDRLVAILGK